MNRQEERRDRSIRGLLDAALAVFGEKGFSESNLEEVAKRAGVSRSLIYHHFGSKDALFLELHDELHKALFERVQTAVSTDRGPLENLVKGSGAFLKAMADLPVARILLLEMPAIPGLRKQMEEREREWSALIAGELTRAVRKKQATIPDPAMTARLLLGALEAVALVVVADANPARASRRAQRALAHLVEGLRTPV